MEVDAWAVADEWGSQDIELSVHDRDDGSYVVRIGVKGGFACLPPARARELARDLNAAARAASK